MNLGDFTPILIMLVLASLFAVGSLVASSLVRPRRFTRAKVSPYESGIEPGKLPQGNRYPAKFYLTAMLFVLFDVEVIFLYPWAVAFHGFGEVSILGRDLQLFVLGQMAIFVGLVLVAYVYDWKRGGLDWERT